MKNRIISFLALCAMAAATLTGCETNKPEDGVTITVQLDATTHELTVGEIFTLNATVLPETVTNRDVTWSSSDDSIAAVGIDGSVLGVAAGTATITATSAEGGKTADCVVTVSDIEVTIKFDKEQVYLSLLAGDKATITATVEPADIALTWKSDDTSIANVAAGVVTAVAEGSTKITATAVDGTMASCEVTVDWLGQAAFFTENVWNVGEQTWSDVVVASGCLKEDYDGGTINADFPQNSVFMPACRMNLQRNYGDLFSWQAVFQFRDRLCPEGWRVPTNEEFMQLDLSLGGTGGLQGDMDILDQYLNTWGAQYGGVADNEFKGALSNQGYCATYWSQSEYDAANGRRLVFCVGGEIDPNNYAGKDYGMTLRCIKE
jgi:uncharacterized protein (TIGR02145 family)